MADNDLKKLFQQNKFVTAKSVTEIGDVAESPEYVKEYYIDATTFLPPVDYGNPNNFARFGSAKEYYQQSIKRVYTSYPYDGSLAERTAYQNTSSYLERWMLESRYPRSTGYVNFNTAPNNTWIAANNPTIKEYIHCYGGPGTGSIAMAGKPLAQVFADANIYDTTKDRESNLKFDFDEGLTFECWAKMGDNDGSNIFQTLFQLGNSVSSPISAHGSLWIYRYAAGFGAYLYQPGAAATYSMPLYLTPHGHVPSSAREWHHYAFSFKNDTGGIRSKTYMDGKLVNNLLHTGIPVIPAPETTGSLQASVGGMFDELRTNTTTTSYGAGWSKMSGSIDEARYWKTERTAEQIGRYWLSQVGGGTNNDDANTDLGVYYKFNEGITGHAVTDSVTLDYSGRVTNGNFIGYNSTYSRNTGSAIVSSSAAPREFRDPIIRSNHPDITSLLTEFELSGTYHDDMNNSSIYNSIPTWILEEDDTSLLKLTQIMSSYLDTLYLQTEHLPKIKDTTYLSGSASKPPPFANRLLDSVGFISPEIFVDADILEELTSRTEKILFDEKLHNIKNLIYQNIYNNLTYIYKSKGTEKAFRNLVRCYGIDDEIVKLNIYADNSTYLYEDNYRETAAKKNAINFNRPTNFSGTVYQNTASSDGNSTSFISSNSPLYAFIPRTIEGNFLFPKKLKPNQQGYFATGFLTASLFGAHTARDADPTNMAYAKPDLADFQVYAIRPEKESKSVRFMLTSSAKTAGSVIPELKTDLFEDVYDNQNWNLSVRIKPTKYPVANYTPGTSDSTYKVEFYGYNNLLDTTYNSFALSATIDNFAGKSFLTSSQRLYAGSHITNFTGTFQQYTDVRVNSVRYWMDYLENDELIAHAKDPFNYGRKHPFRSAYPMLGTASFGGLVKRVYVPQEDTLALNWDFQQVTSSDATGGFLVDDYSSGSARFQREKYNFLGTSLEAQHPGRGYNFPVSNANVVDVDYIYSAKQNLPENVHSSDMVKILSNDDITFTRESRPIRHFFAFEKSMYDAISLEMIEMFSTIKDFSNLVGNPVNRYRARYKDMEKLRSLFFERIGNTPDLDKYVDFYRWIDSSLGKMLSQLIPASADFGENVRNMVESHVLERSKYRTKLPTLDSKIGSPGVAGPSGTVGLIAGSNAGAMAWAQDHAPLPPEQMENNRAVYFDGTTYFRINVGVSSPWRPITNGPTVADHFTFMAWIRTKNAGTPLALYGARTSAGTQPDTLGLIRTTLSSGDWSFVENDGTSAAVLAGTTNLQDNNWHHIACSYEYAGGANTGANDRDRVRLYTDGVLRNTGDVQVDIPSANCWQPTIGTISSSATDLLLPFVGSMDEIAFFNVNLTDAEITSQYNSGIPTSPVTGTLSTHAFHNHQCTAWYRGNKNIGTSLVDYTGYGNTATPTGSPTIVYPAALQRKLDQDKNCVWWKKRANREDPPFTIPTGSITVNQNRQTILNVAKQTYELEQRRPVKLKINKNCEVHGGINYAPDKKVEYVDKTTVFQSSNSAVSIPASSFLSSSCTDVVIPPHEGCHTKTKIAFKASTTADPDGIKGGIVAPFNLVEDYTVSGGYNQQIKIGLNKSVAVTNLHVDGEEIPMQGPFSEAWVGGRQYRHADLTTTPGAADASQKRGEAWRLTVDASSKELQFRDPVLAPPSPTHAAARTKLFREARAKRPLNIANIRYTTSSAKLGNYDKNYQIINTTGRTTNNLAFVQDGGFSQLTPENQFLSQSSWPFTRPRSAGSPTPLTGTVNFTLPSQALADGTYNKTVIVNHFNAPGGKDVSSRGVLNPSSEEYASMNALPWRNRVVRMRRQDDLTVHAGQFGTYPFNQFGLNFRGPATGFAGTGKKDLMRINSDSTDALTKLGIASAGAMVSFSLSFWIRVEPNAATATMTVCAASTEAGARLFSVDIPSTGKVRFNDGSVTTSTDVGVDDNAWHHYVFAYTHGAPGSIAIYQDGVQIPGAASTIIYNATNRVTMGAFWQGVWGVGYENTFYLNGDLDEFSVWNKVLSSGEVATIYNGASGFGHPGDLKRHSAVANLQAWWRLGDDIATWYDSAGSNHGTLSPFTGEVAWTAYPTTAPPVVTDVLRRREGLVTGSAQKANRNPLKRNEIIDQTKRKAATMVVYDNGYVTHPIPRSDIQYRWIRDSYFSTEVLGYATSSSDITFVAIGDVSRTASLDTYSNSLIYEPIYADAVDLAEKERNRGKFTDALILGVSSPAGGDPATSPAPMTDYINSSIATLPLNKPAPPGPALVHSPDYFNVLMLNRNGLGGYSTWKQLRTRQHPIVRHLIENNYHTYTRSTFNANSFPYEGDSAKAFMKYSWPSSIQPVDITNHEQTTFFVVEPVISYNGAPMVVEYCDPVSPSPRASSFSLLNSLDTFANDVLVDNLNRQLRMPESYNIFLKGFKDNPDLKFKKISIRNLIYPRAVNATLAKVRGRLQYPQTMAVARQKVFGQQRLFWHDSLADRLRNTDPAGSTTFLNSLGVPTSYGSGAGYYSTPTFGFPTRVGTGASSIWPLDPISPEGDGSLAYKAGELAQDTRLTIGVRAGGAKSNLSEPSQQYALSGTGQFTQFVYQANTQAGKNPWFDSYEDFSQDIRNLGKDCTIIPEYRISDHMDYYLANGFYGKNNAFLSLEGAGTSAEVIDSSAASETAPYSDSFFTTYTHTDFMKYFGQVRSDYSDLAKPSKIALKCNVIKKLLPYQGYYPVTRCVQLGTMFSSSHGEFITGSSHHTIPSKTQWKDFLGSATQPLFAPGILYNSIKAGFGYPYPIYTSQPTFDSAHDTPTRIPRWAQDPSKVLNVLGTAPDTKLKFDDLLLGGYPIDESIYMIRRKLSGSYSVQPLNSYRNVSSKLTRLGSDNYVRAMHNWLSEVGSYYLENDGFSVVRSATNSKWRPMESGKTYYMDVSIYKTPSMIQAEGPGPTGSCANTRGSAYGFMGRNWDSSVRPTQTDQDPLYALYTPPSFYGKETVTIAYTATNIDEVMTPPLAKIAASSSLTHTLDQTSYKDYMPVRMSMTGGVLGTHRMKVTGAVELFERTRAQNIEYDSKGNVTKITEADSDRADMDVWALRMNFECPTLNFSASAKGHHTRGMWAQYGEHPAANEGIYFAVEENPDVAKGSVSNAGSLVEICGFDTTPKKVGVVASKKEISEAIVAIPFTQIKTGKNKGNKKFIKINKNILKKQKNNKEATGYALPEEEQIDTSITEMLGKLDKYVLPPNLDFLRNKMVDPFVIYLFEFKHDLDRDDLADIWQGLMPKISLNPEVDEASIAHSLSKEEFFHGKPLPADLRWMVFKVKRRATTNNFYNARRKAVDKGVRITQAQSNEREWDYSYNWPHDFCSLIELAKLESGVESTVIRDADLGPSEACSDEGERS